MSRKFKKYKTMKTLSNSLELSKLNLSIKDCLKMIGIKELTANVYEIPKNLKKIN